LEMADDNEKEVGPTVESLQSMRVAELRNKLAEFGLANNGIKSDLVQRLFKYYQEQAAAKQTEEKAVEEENKDDAVSGESAEGDNSNSRSPSDTNDADSQATAGGLLNLQFGPPKAHPAGPPPEEAKPIRAGPVPLMSLELAPPPELKKEEDKPSQEAQVLQLPRALEEALAYKSERAEEMGVGPDTVASFSQTAKAVANKPGLAPGGKPQLVAEDDEDDGDTKGKQRKKQKKKKKKNRPEMWARQAVEAERRRKEEEERAAAEPDVEVEYIQEELDMDPLDPMFRTFNRIFQTFKIVDPAEEKAMREEEEARKHAEQFKKVPKLLEDDDLVEETTETGEPKLSKRKLKKLNRLSVAELKQLVARPDVVEMHDVTARDPRLLVHLKSTRNTVPVPRHWCFKRKYLQGKRGIEKPPFDLPDFIKKTGIMEMREALQEKEDAKGMKSKMREKVRPKLGKIDIDYQKLHDAFFKWQTKPKMTLHGDLYYEGKEFEIRLKEKKPGDLSDDLRTALGMPVGPNAHKVPPPWLIAMQRYGPPPSYPNLKIPGLNAPIPDGCSFGYHAGGWGKPPVDEQGKPLYGDVFGTSDASTYHAMPVEEIDHTLWGEMDSESEEEESSDEEEEEEEDEAGDGSGLQTPVVDAGLATPSGTTSVGAGLETPDNLELRKRRIEADMEGGETPSLPYQILPEKRNERIGASMMGSTHTYDLGKRTGKAGRDTAVELALNPEEIDMMDSETMAIRAEAALREQQSQLAKEDLSDMVAEHAAKQKNKRKRQEAKEDPKTKKYKEFKF